MGRSKLTPEVHAAIINTLKRGGTLRDAAYSAGITERTLRRWRKEGENAKWGKKHDFVSDLSAACACAREGMTDHLYQSLMKSNDHVGMMRWLARRDPENWARREAPPVEVSVTQQTSVIVPEVKARVRDLFARAPSLANGGDNAE